MLIQFRVENFRSFGEQQQFCMVASPDDSLQQSLIENDGFKLLRIAMIFGANASGKSNLLKAFSVLRNFVAVSAREMNLGDKIPGMEPFRLNKKWRGAPCRFEIAVVIEKTTFMYSVAASPDRVFSESLFVRKPNGRTAKKFTRNLNPETGETVWEIVGIGKRDEDFLKKRTRENGLLLSRAAELNFESAGTLFLWFTKSLWGLDLSDNPTILVHQTAQRIQSDRTFKQRVMRMMKDADLGISDIQAKEEKVVFPTSMPERLAGLFAQLRTELGGDDMKSISVQTVHVDSDNKPVVFSLREDESNGTQRFFAIAGPLLDALDSGAIVVIDELECSMHPLLTRKIVELFQNPDANPKGAQLIFATQDSALLECSLFRRDQMWITQKKNNGETDLYSLFDFDGDGKPRKDSAFQKQYLEGRYGGVPSFGPVFEDLEIP